MNLEDALKVKFGGFTRQGDEYLVTCPECGRDKLSINAISGLYHCWVCGEDGPRGCVKRKFDKLLRGLQVRHGPPPPVKHRVEGEPFLPCPECEDCIQLDQLDQLPAEERERVQAYLRMRLGDELDLILPELIQHWDIQYCVRGREFARGLFDTTGTLVVPFYEKEWPRRTYEFKGWQARLLVNPDEVGPSDLATIMRYRLHLDKGKIDTPKYFTMPGYLKERRVQNLDKVVRLTPDRLAWRAGMVVCEGFWDAVAVGPTAGVYLMGKTMSDEQACQIGNHSEGRCVVLLLDPDAAEDQAKAAAKLKAHGSAAVLPVTLEGYKDAGEAGRRETWRQIMAAAGKAGMDLQEMGILLPEGI